MEGVGWEGGSLRGRNGARRRGTQRACEGGSEEGGPQPRLAPTAESKQCSVRGAGELLCSEGSAGRNQRETGFVREEGWKGERREVEGSRGQAKGSILGGPRSEDPALLGDGSQGERRLLGGSRGEGAKVFKAEMGLCCGEPAKMGGLRERSGSLRGKVGGDERGRLGNR